MSPYKNATVSVARHQRTYRRSVNGAWLGAPTVRSEDRTVKLDDLSNWTIGDGWLDVTFPDGVTEVLFARIGGHTGAEFKFSFHPRLREWLDSCKV